jgi:hypothetical protein
MLNYKLLIINTLAQPVDFQCFKKFFIEYQHVSKTPLKKTTKKLGNVDQYVYLYYITNEMVTQ